MSFTKKINHKLLFYIISTAMILISSYFYLSLVNTDFPMVDRERLIDPLKEIDTPNDYIKAHQNHRILDVQPVRDLFHFIDIKLGKLFNLKNFGIISNFSLFIFIFILLVKIFKRYLKITQPYPLLVIWFHPAYYYIFIEPTSKKHILSFFFSLLCIYFYSFKNKKTYFSSLFFHILSVFSHPINLYTPLLFLFKKEPLKQKIKKLAPFFLISFIIAIINLYYYSVIYPKAVGFSKQIGDFSLGKTILAIGVYAKQFFAPFEMSIFYSGPGLNELLGTIGIIIFIYASFKIFNVKKVYFIWLPFFMVMVTLYHKGIDILYLNTYLLTPAFSLLMFITLINKKLNKAISFLVLILAPFAFYNLNFHKNLRKEKIKFNLYRFKNQPNCRELHSLLFKLGKEGPIRLIPQYTFLWLKNNCIIRRLKYLHEPLYMMTIGVFASPEYSLQEKFDLYEKRISSKIDLIYLKEASKIRHSSNYTLKTDFSKLKRKSIFFNTVVAQTIEKRCKKKMTDQCKSFFEYKDRTKDKEIIFEIKKPLIKPVPKS